MPKRTRQKRRQKPVSDPLYEVEIERPVQKVLDRLPRNLRERLVRAMDKLAENPRPRGCVQLKGHRGEYYRIRVGDWRIIYTIKDDVLIVIVVQLGPRGDVYEGF
jgi:mRNA interferase RelE/StbE